MSRESPTAHLSCQTSARRQRQQPNKLARLLAVGLLCLGPLAGPDQSQAQTTPAPANASEVQQTSGPIKLGVYMESLCPDTRRFFRNQLVPTHRLLGAILDVKMVPFGHARVLASGKMICQHGPRECEGNKRMACILARSSNQTQLVETLGCLMRLDSSPRECVAMEMAGLNFDELEKCTTGDEGHQLMVAAEKETGRLDYVPHLTVGGQSSDEIQDQAEHHLKDYVCSLYAGPSRPEACAGGAQQPQAS